MLDTERAGYELAIKRIREMAAGERWKAEHGPAGSAEGFRFRSETLEQVANELAEEIPELLGEGCTEEQPELLEWSNCHTVEAEVGDDGKG